MQVQEYYFEDHHVANTHHNAALLLHATRSVVEISELHCHLMVSGGELLFTLLHVAFKTCTLAHRPYRSTQLLLDFQTYRVQSVHDLDKVLLAELNLHCTFCLQHTTSVTSARTSSSTVREVERNFVATYCRTNKPDGFARTGRYFHIH